MAGTNRRQAPISVFLVAIMVTSVFAGVSFTFESAKAISDASTSGISGNPVFAVGDPVEFTVSVDFEGLTELNPNPDCAYYLDADKDGQTDSGESISVDPQASGNPTCPSQPSGQTGSNTQSVNVQWIADATPISQDDSGYAIIVEVQDSDDGSVLQTATTGTFGIDSSNPEVDTAASDIRDAATSVSHTFDAIGAGLADTDSNRFGKGPVTLTIVIDDAFPDQVTVRECGTSDLISQASSPDTGTDDRFTFQNQALSKFTQNAPSTDSGTFGFTVEAQDEVGNNLGTPIDFCSTQIPYDNEAPEFVTDLTGFSEIQTSDIQITEGPDYEVEDPDGSTNNVAGVSLETTDPTGTTDTIGPVDVDQTLTLPVDSSTRTGSWSLTVRATDDQQNTDTTSTRSVDLDPRPPELQKIVVKENNPDATCDDKVFTAGGDGDGDPQTVSFGTLGTGYCQGPYTIEIHILEEHPSGNPSISDQQAVNLGSHDQKDTDTDADNGIDQHIWTYTGVGSDSIDQNVLFSVDLDESYGDPARSIGETDVGWIPEGVPTANFQPIGSPYTTDPTFTIDVTEETEGDCPAPPSIPSGLDGAGCHSGSGTLSIHLAKQEGDSFTRVSEFQPTDTETEGEWGTTWTDAPNGVVTLRLEVVKGQRVGASSPVTTVIDKAAPVVDSLSVFEWVPEDHTTDTDEAQWTEVSSNDPDMPASGLYLVKMTHTSFSVKNITFKFIPSNEVGNDDPSFVAFPLPIDRNDGSGVQDQTDEDKVVHLAKNVKVDGGLTPATGCTTFDEDQEELFWGSSRTCWYLIETGSISDLPGWARHGVSSFSDGTDYTIRPVLTKVKTNEQSQKSTTPTREVTAQTSPVSLSAPTISPNPIEVGSRAKLAFALGSGSRSDFELTESWGCVVVPTTTGSPDPEDDPGFDSYMQSVARSGQPTCQPFTDPNAVSGVQAMPFEVQPTDGNDDGERVRNFTIDQIQPAPDGEDAEELYFRVFLKDEFGNLLLQNYDASGPGLVELAFYSGQLRARNPTNVPADLDPRVAYEACLEGSQPDCDDVASFFSPSNTVRCFQADGDDLATKGTPIPKNAEFPDGSSRNGDNTPDNPCVRGRQILPASDGTYEPIEIPVIIENFGSLQDDIVVSLGEGSGAQGWDVQLVDPSGTTHDERIEIPLDERLTDEVPTGQRIKVRFTPNAGATGGETRMVNVTAWSASARDPVHLDFFAEAALLPFEEGQIRVNGSEVEAITTEPDTEVHRSIALTNTGNTDYRTSLAVGGDCTDQSDTPSEDIVVRLETSSGTVVDSIQIDPGETIDLQVSVDVGQNVPADPDGQLFECDLSLAHPTADETPIPLPPGEDPQIDVTVVGEPQARILDLVSQKDEDAEVDVTGDEITRVFRPDDLGGANTVPVTFYLENTGTTLVEPRLTITEVSRGDRFNLGGTWEDGEDDSGGIIALGTSTQSFDLRVSDTDDAQDIEDLSFPAPQSGEFWSCVGNDGDSPSDGEPRELCKITLHFDPGKLPVSGDEVTYNLRFADDQRAGSGASVTVRLVFDHVGVVDTRAVADRVLGDRDTTTVHLRALLAGGHRFDPDATTLRATPVFTLEGESQALPRCGGGSLTTTVRDTTPEPRRAHFNVSIEAVKSTDDPCVTPSEGDYLVNLAADKGFTVSLKLADENGTELRTIHPAHLMLTGSPDTLQPATSIEQGPRDEMDANGTQYADLEFDDRLDDGESGDQRLEGVMFGRSTGQAALEPFLRCAPDDGSAFPSASTESLPGLGTWTWLSALPASAQTIPGEDRDGDGNNEEGRLDIHNADLRGRLMTVRDEDTQTQDRDIRPTGNVDLFGWGDGATLEWREGWNPLVFHIEGLAEQAGVAGSPADNAVTPTVEIRLLAQFDVGDDDSAAEWNRYVLSSSSRSGQDSIELEQLGNGYWRADVYIPEGFSDVQLAEHPVTMDDRSEPLVDAWTLRVELDRSAQTVAGDDLGGDQGATAYWSLEDLGLVDGTVSEERGPSAVDPSGPSFGSELVQRALEDPDDERTDADRIRHVETAIRFLPGAPGTWTTGPGLHTFDALIRLDEAASEEDTQNPNGKERMNLASGTSPLIEPLRNHTLKEYTDARPLLTFFPSGRFNAGGDTVRLDVDDQPGHYTGIIGLRDMGRDTHWQMELNVRQEDRTQTRSLYRMLTVNDDVLVDTTRQAATHGLPMPLCISRDIVERHESSSRPIADVFEEAEFADTTRLDLRAIPGLTPDRGAFTMAPSLVSTDTADALRASRHDATESFTILGAGVIDLGEISFSSPAEVDVPTPVSVRIADDSLLASQDPVRARLAFEGETVDSTSLELTGDGIYEGSLTAVEVGEHTLTLLASDIQGGITAESMTVEVVENAPPRIQTIRPSEVEGIRAMQPNGTVETKVTNSVIAPEHITLLEKTGGDGGVSGSALAESDGVNITGIQDTVAPGSFSLTVNMTDALGEHNYTDVHGWLNVTDADGAAVDSFEGDLDEQASFSGSISLDSAGTYTLRAVGNNTTAAQEVVNTTFTVTVEETSGDFSEVATDDYDVACETTTCTVRYAPSGLSGGQTLTLRYDVVVTEDDQSTNDTVIVIDDLDPSPEITIGTPSSGTTVSPSTLVEVSAGDNTLVDQLVVSGVAGDTELGSTTVSGEDGEVSIRELGLTEDGQATIRLTATDIAGNNATETQTVTVDGTGPDLSDVSTTRDNGDLIVRVTAEDSAGIGGVTLFFQRPGGSSFTTSVMEAAGGGDRYSTSISDVGDTGTFRYYIEATDALDNQEALGSRNNPQTVELGDVPIDTNTAPEVTITSPADGDRVSGEINVSWEVSDAEGDSVSISGVQASPAVGEAVSLTASDGQAVLDTTQLPEGGLTITVDASDGTATGSDSIQVIVDNLAPAPACEADARAEAGQDFEVCFELETESTVTQVELQYVRNGEVVISETLEPSEDGQYRTTVNFPEPGTYTPKVIKTHEDGTTEETTFETQSVREALSDKPVLRFIGMIVLAVAILGVAGYAAFGRWN